jgi:hypothetical protein
MNKEQYKYVGKKEALEILGLSSMTPDAIWLVHPTIINNCCDDFIKVRKRKQNRNNKNNWWTP